MLRGAITYADGVRMKKRSLWSFLPLTLLVALGVPALVQAGADELPEISAERAKAVLESDVLRRSSSPMVTNQFRWTSFEWKGEGDAIFGSAPTTTPVRARFAKVNLVWTQTTRTRLGDVVSVTTFTTQPPALHGKGPQDKGSQDKVVQLPEVIAFFKPPQAAWTYKWQEG